MDSKNIPSNPKLIGDLLDIIHNAIIVISSKNKIIYANSRTAEMFSTSVGDLQKKDIYELFMPDDTEILVSNILHITRDEGEFEGEAMLKRMDGTTFMGLISGNAFKWDGSAGGIAFSIHDMTEVKAIERSLRHSERIAFLGHLIDDISHQIRNPIMVIGGFAKRLIKRDSSAKEVKAILSEAHHLETLLDTLNNFIQLRCPVAKRVPMSELIDKAEADLRDIVEAGGCNWISDYEKDISAEELLIDTELIIKALEAAIINACEAYKDDADEKDIIFQIRRSNDPVLQYVINIIDNGSGICSTVSPHIFGHFYSNKTKHIGMGLTFARRIIEEQRGTLTVTSKKNMGCTISFHLMKERRRPIRTIKLT